MARYSLIPEKKPEPENIGSTILRNAARLGNNTLAFAGGGFAGDIASSANDLVAAPLAKAITGRESQPYEETAIGKILPTTQTKLKGLREVAPQYLSPKNKVEKFIDDVVQTGEDLLVPVGGAIKKGASALKLAINALTTSLGANLAGQGVESLTGSEKAGSYAKMGSLFLLGLRNAPKVKEAAGNLYKQAEKNLPEGAAVSSRNFEKNLTDLRDSVLKGRHKSALAPSEKFLVDEVNTALRGVDYGELPIASTIANKRSLSEKLNQHIYNTKDRGASARAKNLAKQITHEYNKVLDTYAKTNPSWGKPFKQAEEVFSTLARSNFVSNTMEKLLKYVPGTEGLVGLFHGPVSAGIAQVALPYQAGKILYQISKSPTLAKHYSNIVQAALKEDAITVNKEMKILDQMLQKEEKKPGKYRLID